MDTGAKVMRLKFRMDAAGEEGVVSRGVARRGEARRVNKFAHNYERIYAYARRAHRCAFERMTDRFG